MDGEFQGELAEAWKPAADFKSYAIKIRKGVKFHDGKDMTTADVVYSIDEIWKKHAAAASLADFAGVAAADADTVVVSFSKPVPRVLLLLPALRPGELHRAPTRLCRQRSR